MTIVLCGGGSGGHITPLLAVAHELRKRNKSIRLIYIGEKNGKFTHIATNSKAFDEYHYISAGKLRRYHGESWFVKLFDVRTNLLNIRDVFKILAGMRQSRQLLRRLQPDALLLKGGFVCVPVAMAAKSQKIAYITHDSDALPGLANRIAAKWARYHATAMPAKYYRYPEASVKEVGVPTDNRFKQYSKPEQAILREKYGIKPDDKVLLITGGSNGARRMNEAVIAALPSLLVDVPNLRVLHQIGAGNEDQVAEFPDKFAARVDFFDFASELFHMTAIADVVITRAGASIMADLAMQQKACIVIPNPFLAGGHQLKNAQVYADAKAAVVVHEAELDADSSYLHDATEDLLHDRVRQAELGKNLYNLTPKHAASELAELILEAAA